MSDQQINTLDPKQDLRWWRKKDDDVSDCMMSIVRRLRLYQDFRRTEYLLYVSMYGGHQYMSFGALAYMARTIIPRYQLALNVVKSVIDSCVAKIVAKSRPKPSFLTTSDWQLRRKARKMDQAVYGAMHLGGFYKDLGWHCRNGMVYGSGFVKVVANRERTGPLYDRVLTPELLVDDGEGIYGQPRNMYQLRYIDRLVLADMFRDEPDKVEAIMRLTREDEFELDVGYDATADQVIVTEGWHLPSGPLKEGVKSDGSHAICVRGKLLFIEEWRKPRFPFAHFRWCESLMGFMGSGLAQELAGLQFEINEMLDEFEECAHGIKGKWFVSQQANVDTDALNDEGTGIVPWSGVGPPPTYEQVNAIPQDTYQFLQQLRTWAFQQPGLSEMAATSQKPAGLNSGEAIRAYGDTQSERFLDKYQAVESFVCDVAELTLDVLRELSEDSETEFKIKSISQGVLETHDLSKIMIPPDSYHIEIQASSQMPNQLPGRIEFVQELAKAATFDNEELLDLLIPSGGGPDMEEIGKRKNATRRLVETIFDRLIEHNEFIPPEIEMDLPKALKVATEIYLESRNDGMPAAKLDSMRRWIVLCTQQWKKQKQDAMADAAPPMPSGGAVPGAKPLPAGIPPGMMPSGPNGAPPPPPVMQ
jgi:hypothetical protein